MNFVVLCIHLANTCDVHDDVHLVVSVVLDTMGVAVISGSSDRRIWSVIGCAAHVTDPQNCGANYALVSRRLDG